MNERELELLRQIGARDRIAFKELYLIYHGRLVPFLMCMTSRHDLIEEVINDTLWTVWQKAADFRGDSLVSTWIVGIMYRRALKALRKHGSIWPVYSKESSAAPDAHLANENRQWLDCGLRELPFEQRMVLEFSYLLGHSCEEIAEIMQCSVNTVKTRMFHAREKLRRSLPHLAGSEMRGAGNLAADLVGKGSDGSIVQHHCPIAVDRSPADGPGDVI
jgi:RNA polymerase sigma-70 factor, ECF subfamily